jgi:transcriptional regulator with XRE-family HTH domain
MRLKDRYAALSQEQRAQLAEKAGISPAYLYQLSIKFKGKKPSLAVLERLAKADKKLTLVGLVKEFADQPEAAA